MQALSKDGYNRDQVIYCWARRSPWFTYIKLCICL